MTDLRQWLTKQWAATHRLVFSCDVDDGGLTLVLPELRSFLLGGGSLLFVVTSSCPTLDLFAEERGVDVLRRERSIPAAVAARRWDGSVVAAVGTFGLTLSGLSVRAAEVPGDGMLAEFEALVEVPETAVVVGELLESVLDRLEAGRFVATGPHSSGFVDLDLLTGTQNAGSLWVISGESGVGKSVFALGIAAQCALRRQLPTLVQTRRDVLADQVLRLLAAEARVPVQHLCHGPMTDDDWGRIATGVSPASASTLWFEELCPGQPPLPSRNREWSALIVDDLDLKGEYEQLEKLRGWAQQRDAWVVVVVRQVPGRQGTRARVADVMVEIRRDDLHDPYSPRAGEADLVIRRNRLGPTGTVTVAFQGHYARFVDMSTA